MTSSHRERLLRRLEQLSHASTALAFSLTIVLVTTGGASELNPVAAMLFSEAGLGVTGLVAIGVIALFFAYYERHLADYPRLMLGAGALVAAFGVLDLAVNCYILAEAGWPETVHADAYALPAALVLVAGIAAIGRRELVYLVAVLHADTQDWPVSPQQAAAVAFALLLVVSGVGPFASFGGIVPQEHGGVASAADWTNNGTYGGHSFTVQSVTLDNNGTLYSGSNDDEVHKVDTSDMSQLDAYTGHSDTVLAVIMGNDGYLYSGGFDNEIHKIDPATMTRVDTYTGHGSRIQALTMGDDGYLYSGDFGGAVHKIDPSDMSQVDTYTGHSDGVHSVMVGTNGSLYSGDNVGEVHKVDPSNMGQTDTYTGHSNTVASLAMDDNDNLYSGSDDGQVHKLDPSNMTQLDAYTGHSNAVKSITIAPDGYLYSGSSGSEIHRVYPSNMSRADTYTQHSGTIYSLTMDADGYLYSGSGDNTIHKSDPGTSVEESLSGTGPTGQALDQNGDPVSNATVVASYDGKDVNEVLLDGKPYDELQNDPTKNLNSWQNQMENLSVEDPSNAGVSKWYDALEQKDDARVVSHTGADWEKEGIGMDWIVGTPTFQTGEELPGVTLRNPTVVYDADETVMLSTWEGTGTSLATQDGLDQQLPGETRPDNITVERIDPLGDTVWSETYQTRAVYWNRHQGNCGWSGETGPCIKNHHAVGLDLDPGMYRASPEGSEITTVIIVSETGDLEGYEANIENWAANQSDEVSEFNSRARDRYSDLPVEVTQTNETGHYTLNPPSTAESADITVTKTGAEGTVDDPTSVTKQDLRNDIETTTEANFNDEVPTVDFDAAFDARNSDETFQRGCEAMESVANDIGSPYYGDKKDVAVNGGNFDVTGDRILTQGLDPAAQRCAAINFAEQLQNNNLAGVLPAFLDADGWAAKAKALLPLLETNDALKDAVEDATGITIDSPDPDDYSDQQLKDLVSEGGETVDEYADGGGTGGAAPGGGGIPTGGDDGTTAPSVGDGDTDIDEQAETLTEEWPVNGVDDWENADVMVRIHWSDGTTTALGTDSSYVDIEESGFGADTVRLENYPLNASDPPVARTKLTVVSQDGVGNSPDTPDSVVRNPTFDGDIPRLQSLRVSSLAPQAGSNISVAATPADAARFGSVESVTLDGPNCERTVNPSGDEASIETCADPGETRVHVQFTNAGNTSFTETFAVETQATAQSRPASVRGMAGVLGRWAIASDGLDDGRLEVKNGASEIELVAIAEPGDVPNQYSAYATGLDTPKDADVSTRIVAGDSEQTVRERVGVTLHSSRPSNSTLYYRNGAPIPAEEEHPEGRLRFDEDQVVYSTFTDDAGRMSLRVNQNPNFVERVTHWLGTTTFSPLSLGGDVLLLGSPGVVLLWRRRRQPPNGGTQQEAHA